MPNIFDYQDPLNFLRDAYGERRKRNRGFSHRFLARRLGSRSAATFSQILRGERKITEKAVSRLAEVFGLDSREEEYLRLLVGLRQAETPRERRLCISALEEYSPYGPRELTQDEYLFYAKWYYTAVRAVLACMRFTDDYRALAAAIVPPITVQEARETIGLLHRLGLIHQDGRGRWRPTHVSISSGTTACARAAVRKYTEETMGLGKDAVSRLGADECEAATLTLAVSEKTKRKLMDELRALRGRIASMAIHDRSLDRVYQIHLQLFPVAEPAAESGAPKARPVHRRKRRKATAARGH